MTLLRDALARRPKRRPPSAELLALALAYSRGEVDNAQIREAMTRRGYGERTNYHNLLGSWLMTAIRAGKVKLEDR